MVAKVAVNALFGCSLDEPHGDESEFAAPVDKKAHPYTKIKSVVDQRPLSTCVLCSIGAAIHMVTDFPMKQVLASIGKVISPQSVPSQGLVIAEALKELEPVFEDYGKLRWTRILPTVQNLKNSLDNGIPIVVGTKFDNEIFKYSSNLDSPIAGPEGNELMHCVTIVAYDDADSTFTVLNSWGNEWGRNGAMIVEQDYEGFDRGFVITPPVGNSFGAIDIAPNLEVIEFGDISPNLEVIEAR